MGRSRVCFASAVIATDKFLDLPPMAQAVYFQLSVDADNDGAIDGFNRKIRSYGASEQDVNALFQAGFLLMVDSVPFITHWRVNNRTDTKNYRPGLHALELAKINRGENRPYSDIEINQSDISLTSDADINKTKPNQLNESKPNQTRSNFRENKDKQNKFAECPDCKSKCVSRQEGTEVHAFCKTCNMDFYVSEDGEIHF